MNEESSSIGQDSRFEFNIRFIFSGFFFNLKASRFIVWLFHKRGVLNSRFLTTQ